MKILLLCIVLISSLFSKATMCYKDSIISSTIDKSIKLDGKECKGKLSASQMEANGWVIQYSQVMDDREKFYNHLYMFKKGSSAQQPTQITIKEKNPITKASFNLLTKETSINNVKGSQATINIGNLKVGQSGVIVHTSNKRQSLIIANAIVKSTSTNQSILELSKPDNLTQSAMPTSKLKPQDGDTFVLNHLYNSSLLLVPNFEVSRAVHALFPKQNFLNPDLFAAYLKFESTPIPTQEDIQKFCKQSDIGTIFIVVENNLHILDTKTFKTLSVNSMYITDTTTKVPFFTKVQDIKKNFWNFGDKKITDYNNFYLSLINKTTYHATKIIYEDGEENEKSLFDKLWDMLPSW